MVTVIRNFIIFLVLFLTTTDVSARKYFKVINNILGLSYNSVKYMAQDKHGFVWMATANGLSRYDGLMFTVYRHDAHNAFSLVQNDVLCLLPIDGGMYVACTGGLDFYSFHDGYFHRCRLSEGDSTRNLNVRLNSLVEDGNQIMATDGNGNFFVKKDNSESFVLVKEKKFCYLSNYQQGRVLGVAADGLYLIDSKTLKTVAHYKTKIPIMSHINLFYSKIRKTAYVGNGYGQPSMAFHINGHQIEVSNEKVPDNLMAVTDFGNRTAFALDGPGLLIRQGSTEEWFSPENSNMSGDALYSLCADRGGNLWIGTYRAGVNFFNDNHDRFVMLNKQNGDIPYNLVTAVIPDKNRLFIGLDGGGLCIYDKSTKTSKTFTTKNSPIAGDNVISMTKDNDALWMGFYTKGLVRYDLKTGSFSNFTMPKKENGTENNVWVVCDDGIGNLWIGGADMNLFNKQTHQIETIKELKDSYCASMFVRGNQIWIAPKNNGVFMLDKHTRKILKHYTASKESEICLPDNDVRYIYMDSRGILWVSTIFSGFCSLNPKTKELKSYGIEKGLTNTNVASISEDRQGNLWMGTFNGLFKFDPKTDMFVRFDQDECIASTFTYASSTYQDGIVYMGSTQGLLTFNPEKVNYEQLYDHVYFTSLNLLNDNKIFNLNGSHPEGITLKHDQNFFTVLFSVPEMQTPKRVRFSCYLENLETGWREISGDREATYTNVPPGKYHFYVRCTDSNGQWSKPSILEITVTPPWWATWWAKLLWVILTLLALAGGALIYLHNLKNKHQIEMDAVEKESLKKLNDAKLNFYTTITHELRTPVFLISAQLEELLNAHKSIVPVPSNYLISMHRSSLKLNKLISRIIDFRKIDSDKIKLSPVRADVIEFCRGLIGDYTQMCEQKNISFTFCHEKDILLLDFDPSKLEIILTNLVSNAFKYTNENGAVELIVEEEPDRVVFKVKDNGIGILEKMRDTIFESFFRTERGEKQSGGDGIGLSVVKSLVELHGGTIKVDSEVNKGSVFTFYIPKIYQEESLAGMVKPEMSHETIEPVTTPPSSVSEQHLVNPTAVHSILIIDDEHETVDVLERYLSADFRIYKAFDGNEGLAEAEKELPDLILCDLSMPKMDGLEFLRKMKEDKKLSHIKVIIFTAKISEEDMITAFDYGADAYITKPISLKYLRKRIDRLMAQTDNALITNDVISQKKTYNKEEQIFLLRCREIIDNNLQNEEFNIDFLADNLAMSHSSLYKKIKAMTGMSLIEFINDYKIYKAIQMFKQGATSVESVFEQCGFHDAKNFRETFKRKMKMTPKQFIQSL